MESDVNKVIVSFLKELRDSATITYSIYTQGSCFRLYSILNTIYPTSVAYWSDRDNHCITKIGDTFFDIGGEINESYAKEKNYYIIEESHLSGYYLLKYTSSKETEYSVVIEKYK
jgi:hypothetical protein